MTTDFPKIAETMTEPPSFLKQTPWPCDYFVFPFEANVRHFNPSIIRFNSRLLLCTRRSYGAPKPIGQNSLVLWELDDKKPFNPNPLKFIKTHAQEQWEDPRLCILSGKLFVSLTNFKIIDYKAHQLLARIAHPHCEAAHPLYGGNGPNMVENIGNEKNWGWFDHKDGWHFVYHPWPHHVVRTNHGESCASYVQDEEPCPWDFGQMRGGSPPVLLDGLYWCFFHSNIQLGPKRRRYFMGAYAFDAQPPFSIKLVTLEPLLSGSMEDQGLMPVIFPGGAVHQDNKWLVAFGVNDARSAWIEIPHDDLLERMASL